MQKVILLFFLPMVLLSAEHFVPLGTSGNRLLFTIRNHGFSPIGKCVVLVTFFPDWLAFERTFFVVDSLPKGDQIDAEFVFRVSEGEVDREGVVQLVVKDVHGRVLAKKSLLFRTQLAENETKLFPPFPNPANPMTTLRYALAEPGRVKIMVCNILGQKVRILLEEEKPAGQWSFFLGMGEMIKA